MFRSWWKTALAAMKLLVRACVQTRSQTATPSACCPASQPRITSFSTKTTNSTEPRSWTRLSRFFLTRLGLQSVQSSTFRLWMTWVPYEKAKPGTVSYGTFFFPLTRFIDKLNNDKGTDIVRVPFRGGADLANAMLAGSTPIGLFGLSNM